VSRRELDENPKAAEMWHGIRRKFVEWQHVSA
jgi:hypothetical protein